MKIARNEKVAKKQSLSHREEGSVTTKVVCVFVRVEFISFG